MSEHTCAICEWRKASPPPPVFFRTREKYSWLARLITTLIMTTLQLAHGTFILTYLVPEKNISSCSDERLCSGNISSLCCKEECSPASALWREGHYQNQGTSIRESHYIHVYTYMQCTLKLQYTLDNCLIFSDVWINGGPRQQYVSQFSPPSSH